MPNTSSAPAAANGTSAKWSGADTPPAKGHAQGKYTPVHKRPTAPPPTAGNYSRSSSSSSSSSGSRSSSPSPSSVSSMSSAPPSPRSESTKPTATKSSPAPSTASSRASSKSPHPSLKSLSKPRAKVQPITFAPGEPPVYTPSQLFSMRPLALESVKERMKNACPEVTMNRRMRKGLEFAAGAARRAAREAGSGSSTSPSVSGSRTMSSSGSSRGPRSSTTGSSIASTSPSVTGSDFEVSETDDARFLEESILEEDEEARDVVAAQADEYIPPPAPASLATPPKRQPTGRKQALPRDLTDNSWRALKRLGVPVTAV